MEKIIIHTSVDDLYSSFKCSIEHYAVEQLIANVLAEQNGQNRSTVIKLLERAIRMKKKRAKSI